MKALVQWLLSFRCVLLIWALVAAPIGEHLRANYLWVSGGNTNSPYYSFLNQQQQVVDISTYPFQRGSSYVFFAWGVSQNHPFMIGEQNGDNNSSLVSVFPAHLGGTPAPLINQIGNLAITIPNDYNGDLVYFSTEDSSIHYHFKIVDPPGGTTNHREVDIKPQAGDTSPVLPATSLREALTNPYMISTSPI